MINIVLVIRMSETYLSEPNICVIVSWSNDLSTEFQPSWCKHEVDIWSVCGQL